MRGDGGNYCQIGWSDMAQNSSRNPAWCFRRSLVGHECGTVHPFVSLLRQDIKIVTHSGSPINFTALHTEFINSIRKSRGQTMSREILRKLDLHVGQLSRAILNREGSPMFFSGFFFLWYSGQKWRGHCWLYWDRKHCVFTKTYIFFIRSTRLDHISQSPLQEGISNVVKILSSGIWGRNNACYLHPWPLKVSQVSRHGNFIQSTDIGTLEFTGWR